MNFLPADFNPMEFLGLTADQANSKDEELIRDLNKSISEYILIKLTDELTEEQVKTFVTKHSPEEKIEFLNTIVPNLQSKIDQGLESFKEEYKNG